MTDAPERMWIDPDILPSEWYKQYYCDVEYIRADLLDAHIGAVLDEAADRCDCATQDGIGDILRGRADEIRALRPDAMQALERVRREARVEGMRAALACCRPETWEYDDIRALIAAEERGEEPK